MEMSSNLLAAFFAVFVTCSSFFAKAYHSTDPDGNIMITWDVMSWSGDGYIGMVTIGNNYLYRHIQRPGWKLGWTWAKTEVIRDMQGAQATEQGDCSNYQGQYIPHCCEQSPTIIDLMPTAADEQKFANCCRGGVLSSRVQNVNNSVSSFQIHVGKTGTSNTTIYMPRDLILGAPGLGYTCTSMKRVEPSQFPSADKRRVTQAFVTWQSNCTYSQLLSSRVPTCCVSLSSFYNEEIGNCQTCSCGCQENALQSATCITDDSPNLQETLSNSSQTPLHQCSRHMCPIRVHWHIQVSYKRYWRVKLTIWNFNYRKNYTQWNLVVEHPNLETLPQVFSFNYHPLVRGSLNNTGMFWGIEYYNDLLIQRGPNGFVQSEMLFEKAKSSFTFEDGWAFPRTILFNGDYCVMPDPDQYPHLPNKSTHPNIPFLYLLLILACHILIIII